MDRPLTISTELKLAGAFWRGLEARKHTLGLLSKIKHLNKVFPPFPIGAKPVRPVEFLRG